MSEVLFPMHMIPPQLRKVGTTGGKREVIFHPRQTR